jgi:hypothetical protein
MAGVCEKKDILSGLLQFFSCFTANCYDPFSLAVITLIVTRFNLVLSCNSLAPFAEIVAYCIKFVSR